MKRFILSLIIVILSSSVARADNFPDWGAGMDEVYSFMCRHVPPSTITCEDDFIYVTSPRMYKILWSYMIANFKRRDLDLLFNELYCIKCYTADRRVDIKADREYMVKELSNQYKESPLTWESDGFTCYGFGDNGCGQSAVIITTRYDYYNNHLKTSAYVLTVIWNSCKV